MSLREKTLLAISEVHSGNGAEGERIADAALATFREWLEENGLVEVPIKLAKKHAYAGASYLARAGVHGVSPDAFAEAWDEVVFSIAAAPDAMGEK